MRAQCGLEMRAHERGTQTVPIDTALAGESADHCGRFERLAGNDHAYLLERFCMRARISLVFRRVHVSENTHENEDKKVRCLDGCGKCSEHDNMRSNDFQRCWMRASRYESF